MNQAKNGVKQIKLVFSKRNKFEENQEEQIELYWNLKSTPISEKYFEAFKIAAGRNYIYKRDRFFNFKNGYETEPRIIDKLNNSIDTINSMYPELIPHRANFNMTQDYMNQLHVYFEKYRGPLLNPHELYMTATNEVKEAFDELNLSIHSYEDVVLRGSVSGLTPKIHCNFGLDEVVRRYPLADSDYDQFSFECQFGSLFISYCEVGKPLHDIRRDSDEDIGKEVLLLLSYYSADAIIHFGDTIDFELAKQLKNEFYNWWDLNSKKIEQLGFVKYDKKNSIGNICVAELSRDQGAIKGLTSDEIMELISKYQWISSAHSIG